MTAIHGTDLAGLADVLSPDFRVEGRVCYSSPVNVKLVPHCKRNADCITLAVWHTHTLSKHGLFLGVDGVEDEMQCVEALHSQKKHNRKYSVNVHVNSHGVFFLTASRSFIRVHC